LALRERALALIEEIRRVERRTSDLFLFHEMRAWPGQARPWRRLLKLQRGSAGRNPRYFGSNAMLGKKK
jgi:hypothetical protein